MTALDPCTEAILEEMFWKAFEDAVELIAPGMPIDSDVRNHAKNHHGVGASITANKDALCASECERTHARACAALCGLYAVFAALKANKSSIDKGAYSAAFALTQALWRRDPPPNCDDYEFDSNSTSNTGSRTQRGLLCSP